MSGAGFSNTQASAAASPSATQGEIQRNQPEMPDISAAPSDRSRRPVYNAAIPPTNENRPMSEAIDKGRRQLLTAATALTGAAGVAFAAVPFLASWKPSARAKALGAPVEIDISKLEPGRSEERRVGKEWRYGRE